MSWHEFATEIVYNDNKKTAKLIFSLASRSIFEPQKLSI